MKKISLLAASVAIALTGCGGSDGGSDDNGTSPSNGVSIRGFDGYFENAVVSLIAMITAYGTSTNLH